MKRLWKTIPPIMSDIYGFQTILDNIDGLGIIDDSSRYKPIKINEDSHGEMRHSHHNGNKIRSHGLTNVKSSELRNDDIIMGTENKVMNAFYESKNKDYKFVLICHAPSASMIASDIENYANRIQNETNIPASYVNIDGSKDYLYGISQTLEVIGKLLFEKKEKIPNTVNILGANLIEWTEEELNNLKEWLNVNNYKVLTHIGIKETTENIKNAPSASINLVVNISGLKLAKYMEKQFDIPYIAISPFGKVNCSRLLDSLNNINEDHNSLKDNQLKTQILIISEQFMGNAIRNSLLDMGYEGISVLSFSQMDKSLSFDNDIPLTSEDDLINKLSDKNIKIVFCNPNYKPLIDKDIKIIPLSNAYDISYIEKIMPLNLFNEKLDNYLKEELK